MNIEFLAVNSALIPVIIGLVNVVKGLGMNTKYAGLLSIVLGLGLSAISTWLIAITPLDGKAVVSSGLIGILTGLSASGLYSQVKKVVEDNNISL